MAAKGVYISLKEGVDRATLPDNRSMKPGKQYLISIDDFQRLSRSVRESILNVEGIETSSRVVSKASSENQDQYLDLASQVDLSDFFITLNGWKLGQVLQGINGEAFRLCFVGGSDNIEANGVVNWVDKENSIVGLVTGDFAGVVTAAAETGKYVWVQTEGIVSAANCDSSVAEGKSVVATDEGTFVATTDPTTVVGTALLNVDSNVFEVALRSSRARNRYFKRPNIFYPGQ